MTPAERLLEAGTLDRRRPRSAPKVAPRGVLMLAANGRLAYRVLRCVAELPSVGELIVLGRRGESSWSTSGLARSRYCNRFVRAEHRFTDPRTVGQVNALAAALDNPDHVAITIHNYRWRLGLADGEAKYDDLEKKLASAPAIRVPTITMEGDANGAPHPVDTAYRSKFTGRYEYRLISGGIGHNLPQEAPQAFARAVIDVAGW